jgi:hypothetical protein
LALVAIWLALAGLNARFAYAAMTWRGLRDSAYWALASLLTVALATRLLRRLGVFGLSLLLVLPITVVSCFIGALCVLTIDGLGGWVVGGPLLPPQPRIFLISESWFLFLSYLLVYVSEIDRKARSAREAQALAESVAREARLETLRIQLNPHFLFNAINSIVDLIAEDGRRAQKLLLALAELLRRSINQTDSTVTLDAELALLDAFIAIQKARFEDDLMVEVTSSAEARARKVPAFVLQLLVENAIKHGMAQSPMPLEVRVQATVEEEALTVSVSNSGTLRKPQEGDAAGIGLANLRARLATLFPERSQFELRERDGWVHAELRLVELRSGAA